MDQREVPLDWAWIGKEPGSAKDYRVLAASRELPVADGVTSAFVAGVPSSTLPEDTPGGPPWVTFGCHRGGHHGRLLSVSVQDPWQGHDQAGRPIWPRRFFLCRYNDLCAARASYRTTWEAVTPVRLPGPDGNPLAAVARPQPLAGLVAAIDAVGFALIAAMAAALLDDPVAVSGTTGLRLSDPAAPLDRLALLDAIAALLPYGFRADLSASTAVDNTVAHRMRLVLAEYAGRGQQKAGLPGTAAEPRSQLARDYLSLLLDKERWDGVRAVVGYLWDATDACTFGQPEVALEILDGLNPVGHRIRTAKGKAESLASSRDFFRGAPAQVRQAWHSPELDPQTRVKLLRPFLDLGEQPLTEALLPYWEVAADDYAALASQRLDQGDSRPAVHGLLAAESRPDAQSPDLMLRGLLDVPPGPAESGQRTVAARAGLLQRRPVPAPGTFPETRAFLSSGQLAEWPARIVRELLSAEILAASAADRALGWARWLALPPGAAGSSWVTALGFLLTGTGDEAAARSLTRKDTVWAATALTLAAQSGHVRKLLTIPGTGDDLADQAALTAARWEQEPDASRQLVSAVRTAAGVRGLDHGTLAVLDAVLLLLGADLSGFPQVTQQDVYRYDEGFRQVLRSSAVPDPALLATRFLGQLMPVGPAAAISGPAVWLLQAWSADKHLVSVLARFALSPAVAAVLADDSRLTRDFWLPLTAEQPALGRQLAAALLRDAAEQTVTDPAALAQYADEVSGATASPLALALFQARSSGLATGAVIEIIATTAVHGVTLNQRISVSALDDVLVEFTSLLAHPRRGALDGKGPAERTAEAERVLAEFRELICTGRLGAAYGAGYRRSLVRRLRSEEVSRRRLRRRLQRLGRPFGSRTAAPSAAASPQVTGEGR